MTPTTEILVLFSITAVVTFVSHKIIQLYWNRRRLPPGPIPLPLIGNLLLLRQNKFMHQILEEISAKYGPVFTFYFGPMPTIIVIDPVIGLPALKRHQFAGRPKLPATEWLFGPDSIDIALADFGKEWEALRKVGHSAARKYAISPALPVVVNETVDRIIAIVKEDAFDQEKQFTNLMIAILAEAAFGKKYQFDDQEFLKWKEVVELNQEINNSIVIIMLIPMLRFVFRKVWHKFISLVEYQRYYIRKMFNENLQKYTEGKNETFCDAMVTAQREAEAEESWMKPHLKPGNIYNSINDLFSAGTDTTRMTLGWIFLMMCKNPEMQDKMRHEVESIIGDDEDPNIDHRTKCHFISAFISETMRFRPIVPQGLIHKTTVDTELNGYDISADTMVMFSLYNALHSEDQWPESKSFKPERFLREDGTYNSKPNPYFIPFSDGRRSCPGNKLAINDIFLIVARFLQRTTEIRVIGEVTEDHLKGDLKLSSGWKCINYQLQLKLKQQEM